jgi:hypothetical protein
MKLRIAAIGSFVPAGAAVVGSVTLTLLILHSPPARLVPGTAPTDRGHAGALVLPAPQVSRPRANTHLELPHPTSTRIATVAPRRQISRPVPPTPTQRTPPPPPLPPPPPPVQTVPTPVTQPVTTPVTPPVVTVPTTPTNNGRWSRPQTKTWKAAAAKQNERVQKGKPPWAGPKQNRPTTTATVSAAAATAPAPPAAPNTPSDTSKSPPGQDKSPPGQDKVPPGQGKKGQSPHG